MYGTFDNTVLQSGKYQWDRIQNRFQEPPHRDGAMHEFIGLQWAYEYDITMPHVTHFKHIKMNK